MSIFGTSELAVTRTPKDSGRLSIHLRLTASQSLLIDRTLLSCELGLNLLLSTVKNVTFSEVPVYLPRFSCRTGRTALSILRWVYLSQQPGTEVN